MIKVIKYGNKRRVMCRECGSLIEYEKEDMQTVQTGMNEWKKEIECPVCQEKIEVQSQDALTQEPVDTRNRVCWHFYFDII